MLEGGGSAAKSGSYQIAPTRSAPMVLISDLAPRLAFTAGC